MDADVDWDEVEARGRRRELLALPVILVVLGALFGLLGRFAFWEGSGAWIALAVYAGLFLLLLVVARVSPRLRAKQRDAYRLQHAIAHHMDPGPRLRERADALVRRQLATGWFRWWVFVIPLGPILAARWEWPWLAVPSSVVLVGATVALAMLLARARRNARQWAEAPPGPPREIGPPVGWERWLTARRAGASLLGLFLITVVAVALVVALR